MRVNRSSFYALTVVIATAACASTVLGAPTASPNPKNGKRVFETVGCSQCHGTVAQGGSAGPRLAPNPLPAVVLKAYVRKPAGEMPPYGRSVLSDRDLDDIRAYLASIPAKAR